MIEWHFPKHYFQRIELFFVLLLAIIIFVVSLVQFDYQWSLAISLTGMFLGIYLMVSHGGKSVQKTHHHYQISQTHFQLTRLQHGKTIKVKVPLVQIIRHKLDHFFLGGYFLTKQGKKHLVYFNTKKELLVFERLIKKHLKPVK